MSGRVNYTDSEWEIMRKAPMEAALAIMRAESGGPLAGAQEVAAMGVHFHQGRTQYPQNELIADILKEGTPATKKYEHVSPDDQRRLALDLCRQAAELLAQKSTPQETGEYKSWVLDIGQAVAAAASEGGFFNRAANPVSGVEAALLAEVAQVLGISPPDRA